VSSGGTTPAISLATAYGDTLNPYASKTANFVLAAPDGTAGVPTFRAVVAADIPTLNQNTTGTASNVTGTVAIANGGSGQITAQLAINAFAGAVTSGSYLRGNGTNVVMNTIQVADVPTLNQNTTGTSSNVTGTVAIANGGTGATTAATALSNLGAVAKAGDTMTGALGIVAGSASTPGLFASGDTNTGIFFPAADTIAFAEGGVEAARFDSAGNLGVGVTTINTTLHVSGAGTTDGSIKFNNQLNSTGAYNSSAQSGSMVALKYNSGGDYAGMGGWSIGKENATDGNFSSYFAMHTRANGGAITEKARVTSEGAFLIGKTATDDTTTGFAYRASGYISVARGSGATCYFNRTGSDGAVIEIANDSSTVGTISVSGSSTAYNTSSDYRLKNTIAPITGALAKVAQLNPVTYKWNVDGSEGEGFIAHELAEICPQAVSGQKDAVDENGKPQYQGIDVSFLVATLTAAIQEQQALIIQLQADVAALKASA
jgi:hypothetical protein